MGIYHSVEQLVGNTPLLSVDHYVRARRLEAVILAKLERCNPAGSAKDRVALEMLRQAEASGVLQPGGTVIEPTSGNTGIGLASVGAARGYRVIIVMPDSMSIERRQLMKAYGAELVLTPGKLGMQGAVSKAQELHESIPGSVIAGQFINPANPAAHRAGTGPEIWEDTDGNVDIFVAGVGTGGTVSGVGEYLKSRKPDVKIVAVEPERSPLLSKGTAGPHGIQGIGANFVPDVLDRSVIDRIMTVSDASAYDMVRTLGKTEGVLAGISSGAALSAAIALAKEPENEGKTIVALLPDTGERYLSSTVFAE